MFRSLLKNAFRNITHKFGYSFLNILGMTLGITSALFLILYVSDELSFDRYHKKRDRIYRVQSHITETDDEFTWIVAQIPFAPQVKEDYPEVEQFTSQVQGTFGYMEVTFPDSLENTGIPPAIKEQMVAYSYQF